MIHVPKQTRHGLRHAIERRGAALKRAVELSCAKAILSVGALGLLAVAIAYPNACAAAPRAAIGRPQAIENRLRDIAERPETVMGRRASVEGMVGTRFR